MPRITMKTNAGFSSKSKQSISLVIFSESMGTGGDNKRVRSHLMEKQNETKTNEQTET